MARREEFRYHPIDLNKNIAIGVLLPFTGKDGRIFGQSYTTEEQAISNLKSLLLTKKGERRMQPGLGSSIYSTLFEQNVADVRETLVSRIRSDIQYWLPYINIINLEASQDLPGLPSKNDEHGIYISLSFTVGTSNANNELTFLVTNRNITII